MLYAVSGTKGGVGKSLVAVTLAYTLWKKGSKVLLLDLDVECPNDYIILNVKKGERVGQTYKEYPVLIKEKCKKCGVCAKLCRRSAIFWVEGSYPRFLKELCNGCGVCEKLCPYGAIKMEKEATGYVYFSKIFDDLYLATVEAKEGVEETGDVVKQGKEIALRHASELRVEHIVIDTAPGTHCNVINALAGADKVLAVTEPTPLGVHDLQVFLQLVEAMGFNKENVGVVINKHGVGSVSGIIDLVERFGVRILGKVPYDESIAKAYSSGNLLELLKEGKLEVEV